MLPSFRLARPTTLTEALENIGEDQAPYCGGTELLLAMQAGLTRPETLVDVKGLPELAGISVRGGELVIGARETHLDIGIDPLVLRHVPMLGVVERSVGNARVRAQGSIGGNLCFAEPKSDVATALIAMQATVALASPTDQRTVAVEDFILGPYYAEKEPNELLVEVRIPVPSNGSRATYVKYQTMERPTVGVALAEDHGGVRLVVGAVGEIPAMWTFDSPSAIDPAVVAEQVDPTPDLTGSERYKRHVTAVYIRRALQSLVEVRN